MIKQIKSDLVVRLSNLLIVASLPIAGWMANMVFQTLREHDTRITRMEESHVKKSWLEPHLDALRRDISALPKEAPPPWFVQRVDKMDQQLSDLSHATRDNYMDLRRRLEELENYPF